MITDNAHWLSRPRASKDRVVNYLLPLDTGEYTDADVRFIADRYWEAGEAVGIDPLLASAQMILETAHLTSDWAARPHRNPAGIGVTGEEGAGISFPSWALAVRAHVGRILAYSLPFGSVGTVDQQNLMKEALQWRPLADDERRGTGADIETLARHWAADPLYATKIVDLARRLAG